MTSAPSSATRSSDSDSAAFDDLGRLLGDLGAGELRVLEKGHRVAALGALGLARVQGPLQRGERLAAHRLDLAGRGASGAASASPSRSR